MSRINEARAGMQERQHSPNIRVIKDFANSQNKVVQTETDCAKIREQELIGKWMELRRVYLAFEKFMAESFGIR